MNDKFSWFEESQDVTWFDQSEEAVEDARQNSGRVVIKCPRSEEHPWATISRARPLAQFLTRGSTVFWQGKEEVP